MTKKNGADLLRFGLLGCGRIGRIHADSIDGVRRAALVAVADPNLDSARRVAGAKARVATPPEIFDDPDIDAVVIATPTDTHADFIEAAAKAGKAILCEKPVDMSVERIRQCVAKAECVGVPLMIGFNRRFDPIFADLKRRAEERTIGAVEILTISSRDPYPPPLEYLSHSGGIFRDMMIHDFDMARFLLGEDLVQVFAVGSCLFEPGIGSLNDSDTAAVLMKSKSGKLVQISNSRHASYGFDQRIEIHGSAGMLRADNVRPTTIEHFGERGATRDKSVGFFAERYAASYREEMSSFVETVLAGRHPNPSGRDGLAAQAMADAAAESARTGQLQRLDGQEPKSLEARSGPDDVRNAKIRRG